MIHNRSSWRYSGGESSAGLGQYVDPRSLWTDLFLMFKDIHKTVLETPLPKWARSCLGIRHVLTGRRLSMLRIMTSGSKQVQDVRHHHPPHEVLPRGCASLASER